MTFYVEHNGKTQSLTAWAHELGIPYLRLRYRVRVCGMSIARAIAGPRVPSVHPSWPPNVVAELKRLWEVEEWPAGAIAIRLSELLGEHITRDAVIGKVHRLKLTPRPSPIVRRA